jgi:hypothetical protein
LVEDIPTIPAVMLPVERRELRPASCADSRVGPFRSGEGIQHGRGGGRVSRGKGNAVEFESVVSLDEIRMSEGRSLLESSCPVLHILEHFGSDVSVSVGLAPRESFELYREVF